MEDHLSILEEVFQAHESAGIKLKAEKCKLFRSELPRPLSHCGQSKNGA